MACHRPFNRRDRWRDGRSYTDGGAEYVPQAVAVTAYVYGVLTAVGSGGQRHDTATAVRVDALSSHPQPLSPSLAAET